MPSEPRLVSQTAADTLLDRQDELPYRRRQQALLREFGTAALQPVTSGTFFSRPPNSVPAVSNAHTPRFWNTFRMRSA